jgi:hypothetical protein
MFLMNELNTEQLRRASEILGNMAVAWFTVGVITPMLVGPENAVVFVRPFMLSLLMTGLFSTLSLFSLKGMKHEQLE